MQNDKYAPNSFFFIDPTAFTQSAGQTFGPVSNDEFSLTTKFTFSAVAMAYAICKSVVLIQPQLGMCFVGKLINANRK